MRIVIFGATGYTGRLVAERLVARGVRPVLAARSPERLEALAEHLGGLEARVADAARPGTVFDLLGEGDVLVSTVGPFGRYGTPAVRSAIAAGGVYLDSTGEPAFIRRVFEELGPPARRAGAALLTAMGYDYVPGALAGALALDDAGGDAVRVDVGYYALGRVDASAGTRASALGVALEPAFAFRGGRIRRERNAARVRSFEIGYPPTRERPAVSVGGAEHYGLPAVHATLRDVNVYLGWFGPLSRALQVASLAGSAATRLPGVRTSLAAAGDRLLGLTGGGPDPGTTSGALSVVVAEAFDSRGERLTQVRLEGADPYAFTAAFLAWAARRAAAGAVAGTGALGPVEAFGLAELETGCREAGIERVA